LGQPTRTWSTAKLSEARQFPNYLDLDIVVDDQTVYFVGGLDGAAGQSDRVDIFDRTVLEGHALAESQHVIIQDVHSLADWRTVETGKMTAVSALADQLNTELKQTDAGLHDVGLRVGTVDLRVTAVENRVTPIEGRVGIVEGRITQVDGALRAEIAALKRQLENINPKCFMNPPALKDDSICVPSDDTGGSSNAGKIALGVTIPLVAILGAAGFWFYRRKQTGQGGQTTESSSLLSVNQAQAAENQRSTELSAYSTL